MRCQRAAEVGLGRRRWAARHDIGPGRGQNNQEPFQEMSSGFVAICFGFLVPLVLTALAGGAIAEKGDVLVIQGGTLIDCTGGPPIRDAAVLIEGGTINAVGRRGAVQVPRGARLIDAAGNFIVPGLIDMHVHYREWHGELYLAGGVTTVKDLGNPAEWISELSRLQKQGQLHGPRIFYVGNNIDSPATDVDHAVRVSSLSEADA